MSILSKPYTFSPNTTISSSEVNANFDTLYNDYNGGISAANLADNAVTTAKIADLNVTTAKLADGSVTSNKLNMSRCVLYETGGQNLPSGTFTPITFTTEIDDPLNMHNTSSNTSRITVPEAGVYLVTGGLRLGDNTTDTVRIAELRRNGSTNTIADYRSGVDSAGRWAANLSTICMLNANDYIELYVLQTSGSTLAATFRHLAVVRIS